MYVSVFKHALGKLAPLIQNEVHKSELNSWWRFWICTEVWHTLSPLWVKAVPVTLTDGCSAMRGCITPRAGPVDGGLI